MNLTTLQQKIEKAPDLDFGDIFNDTVYTRNTTPIGDRPVQASTRCGESRKTDDCD